MLSWKIDMADLIFGADCVWVYVYVCKRLKYQMNFETVTFESKRGESEFLQPHKINTIFVKTPPKANISNKMNIQNCINFPDDRTFEIEQLNV